MKSTKKRLLAGLLSALLLTSCTSGQTNYDAPENPLDLAAAAKMPTGAEADEEFINAVTDFSEDFCEKIPPFLNLRRTEFVIFVDGILNFESVCRHFSCVVGIVKESGFRFFLFGHAARNRFAKNRFFVHDNFRSFEI